MHGSIYLSLLTSLSKASWSNLFLPYLERFYCFTNNFKIFNYGINGFLSLTNPLCVIFYAINGFNHIFKVDTKISHTYTASLKILSSKRGFRAPFITRSTLTSKRSLNNSLCLLHLQRKTVCYYQI